MDDKEQMINNNTKGFNLLFRTHYPGQYYRDKTSIFYNPIPSIDKNKNKNIVSLYEVNIIRKRHNANIPCDPIKNWNDDDYWRRATLSFLGCVPPYWKTFSSQSHFNLPACNSSGQLKGFYTSNSKHLSSVYDNISSVYTPPCDEMSVVPTFYQQSLRSRNEFQINIKYLV